jgi:hypothetical protein
MSAAESTFIEQLAYLLASDGPITIKKVGRTFVVSGKTNTATFPENTVPNLTTSYRKYKSKK